MNEIVDLIKESIRANTSDKSKAFWSKYLRDEIEFIGIGIPEIRKILKETIDNKSFSIKELKNISYKLFQSRIAEDKLAGILVIQLFIINYEKDNEVVKLVNRLFDKKLIFDWNTCDWLCVRILTPLIDNKHFDSILIIKQWKDKEYLWQARASLVSFAQAKSLKQHMDYIDKAASQLIKREERFIKTAVGWVLREISKFDMQYVKEFLFSNALYLTSEVINNSLKYFTKNVNIEIRKHLKDMISKSNS